jgi:urocanate hydratase
VFKRVLAWQGYIHTNACLNKNVAEMVELPEFVLDFMKSIACNGVAPYKVTKLHKCCEAFNHV